MEQSVVDSKIAQCVSVGGKTLQCYLPGLLLCKWYWAIVRYGRGIWWVVCADRPALAGPGVPVYQNVRDDWSVPAGLNAPAGLNVPSGLNVPDDPSAPAGRFDPAERKVPDDLNGPPDPAD